MEEISTVTSTAVVVIVVLSSATVIAVVYSFVFTVYTYIRISK